MQRLLVTAGEPAGIGPELCLTLAGQPSTIVQDAEIVIVADMGLLQDRAAQLGLAIDFCHVNLEQAITPTAANQLKVLHVPLKVKSRAGHLDSNNSAYVLNTLTLSNDHIENLQSLEYRKFWDLKI